MSKLQIKPGAAPTIFNFESKVIKRSTDTGFFATKQRSQLDQGNPLLQVLLKCYESRCIDKAPRIFDEVEGTTPGTTKKNWRGGMGWDWSAF